MVSYLIISVLSLPISPYRSFSFPLSSIFAKVETKVTGRLNCQHSKVFAKHLTFDSVSPRLPPHSHLACMGTSLREITISGRINEACFLLNLLPPTQYGYAL